MLDKDLGGGIITVGVFYIVHYKYKNRGVQMDKKRMILASLASAAVLGAGFTTVQPLVVKADENAAKPATPKVIQDAQADADKADAKVKELEKKVADKTTEATTANNTLESEKKEATDAEAAKTEAEKAKKDAEAAKTTADSELTDAKAKAAEADAKAKEEAKKEEDKAKEDADTKKAISDTLDKLVADAEKAINDNKKITDKEKAIKELKEKIGKEDLLAAIEAGEISIDDVATELNDDAAKAEANEAADKKMRDKDQAAKSTAADAGATSKATTDKKDMPADLKATIADAEKADAARPESEKLQDKADQLDDQLNRVENQFNEAKKVAEEKAAVLDKKEKALKEAKEAADVAEKYNLKDDIVSSLKNIATEIEKDRNEANSEFEQADEAAAYYAEQGKKLEAEYDKTEAAVKAAKEEEAKNPKPAEKPVEKPKVKTEAEQAAEAKAEADKKVAEAQAKVAAATTKVTEATKALEEATTKATEEEADVQPAEDAKTAADKAKSDAETELAKAKEEAAKAKAKVEELKKDEADSLAGLKYALEKMEADAIEKINKDDKITDKDAAIEKAKAAIGKEDLLKAIENGEISASEAARDLDDQAATAEANKNQDPQADNIGAATPTIENGDKVSAENKKVFAEADKKAAEEEAARPESEKIQDKADQLLKEINYLTAIADKDKAAAEVLLEKFNHAKEVLLEARQAKRAAEEANATPEVLKALTKVVYNLRLDRDTAKQELTKVVVPLEAYTEQINKLTDEYNQTLKDLEAAKAKEASTEKLDTPTTEETLAKEKEEADTAEKEYEKLLKAKEADKPKDVVTDKGEPAVQPENPEGVVTDNGEPAVQPENPEGTVPETPAAPAKPVEKSEAEKKVDALKGEIADLEAELAKDKDNEDISDKLNAMRSALARAEKDLKVSPDALIYAVLLPKVDVPTASTALEAEINKLKEELKTADESKKAELEKKIAEQEALLNEVKEAEAKASKKLAAQKEFLENFDKALEQEVKELEEKAKENPEIKDQIQGFIDELKKQAAVKRADFEKRFEEGLTAEEADAEVEKDAQAEEEAEKKEAEELAAQKSFLAEFDKALEETVKELEKAETNSPEEATAKADTIKKLKEEAAKKRADFVKRFEEGKITAEEAKAEVDKFNNASEKKEESKKVDTDAEIEALQNKVADLEKEVAELEKLVADNENNPDAVDYVTATKEKLEAKKAELEKAEAELDLLLYGVEPAVNEVNPYEGPVTGFFDETGENPIAEGELGTHAPRNIPGYTYTGVSYTKDGILRHTYKAGFNGVPADNSNPGHQGDGGPRQDNRPTPGSTTPGTPAPTSAETPAATPATPAAEAPATAAPAVAGTSQDNTYQAPAAKAADKKELPNTGGKDNVAIASLGFLGLLLGALPFAKRKN